MIAPPVTRLVRPLLACLLAVTVLGAAVAVGNFTASTRTERGEQFEDSSSTADQSRDGTVHVEPQELDLGVVQYHTLTRGAFTLHNRTDDPVSVEAITTSCGCAVLKRPEGAIQPGEPVSLPVELFVPTRSGRNATETVAIVLDDPGLKPIRCKLRYSTDDIIRLVPTRFRTDLDDHRSIRLEAIDEAPFGVLRIEPGVFRISMTEEAASHELVFDREAWESADRPTFTKVYVSHPQIVWIEVPIR